MQYRNTDMAEGSFYTYWFEKNLQGDVVAVYTDSGTKIISYAYDAWGNTTITSWNAVGTRYYAQYNPFRYRGYYYDTETGFYYLNSRYYDPKVGRFINADGYVSTETGFTGYNMFAYCNNNPVMGIDPTGKWTFSIGSGFSAVLFSGMSYSINLSFDSHGNVALQTTKANVFESGGGVILGIASIGSSVSATYTRLDSVDDLEDISCNFGLGIPKTRFGVEANMTPDLEVVGGTVSMGSSIGVDVHFSGATTTTVKKFNIVDTAKGWWAKIRGWFSP